MKAWLVDWGHEEVHEEVKKTSVNYIRTETPVPLPSTRTGGTKNYNIPISGTAVKIPWSGYWWPLADRDIYGTDIINLYDNNRAMEKYDHYVLYRHGYNPGASILEPEPFTATKYTGIDFAVGDQKGLLTELHCNASYDFFNGRGCPAIHSQ